MNLKDKKSEKKVVAYLLVGDPKSVMAFAILTPDHFTIPEAKWIFSAMKSHHEKSNETLSIQAMKNILKEKGLPKKKLQVFTSFFKIIKKEVNVKTDRDFEFWIDLLEEVSLRRDTLSVITGDGQENPGLLELMDEEKNKELGQSIDKLYQRTISRKSNLNSHGLLANFPQANNVLKDMKKNPEKYRGITMGIPQIDYMTAGILSQELGIIAAPTGVGKTSLAAFMAYHALLQGEDVAFISIEMPRIQIIFKIWAKFLNVDSNIFRLAFVPGKLKNKYQRKLERMIEHEKTMRTNDIWVIDIPSHCSADDVELEIEKIQQKIGRKISLAIVDHLNLMRPCGNAASSRLGHESQTQVAHDLKFMARKMEMGTWALTQGTNEKGSWKTQGVHSLSFAKNISQACDIGMILLEDPDGHPDQLGFRMFKYRYGTTGTVWMDFNKKTGSFSEPKPKPEPIEENEE